MLTHAFPHKSLRNIKVAICNHQTDGPLYVWPAWCLIWWFASLEKYGHTWYRMSLLRPGVIKQHKPNQMLALVWFHGNWRVMTSKIKGSRRRTILYEGLSRWSAVDIFTGQIHSKNDYQILTCSFLAHSLIAVCNTIKGPLNILYFHKFQDKSKHCRRIMDVRSVLR